MGDLLVPYSLDFMCAKIEKPSAFHNVEGWTIKATCLLIICQKRTNANIVNVNGKTKPLPIMLSNLCGNQGKGVTLSTWLVSDCCISLSDIIDCLPIMKPSKMPPVSRMIV